MAKKFFCSIDLNKNEIQNVVLHRLAAPPANPVEGQSFYDTTDNAVKVYNGTAWVDITGRLKDILSTTNALVVTDNNDGTLSLSIADASATQSGLLTPVFFADLNEATHLATADKLVKRDGNGNITVPLTPANPTDAVSASYVDGLIATGMKIVGSTDASTNPDYPAAKTGEAYVITVAGRIGGGSGELVEVGDMVVASADNVGGDEAAVGTSWFVIQANLDQATEVKAGKIRIATAAEVAAGVSTDTAVTPATMATYVNNLVGAGSYSAQIGDGVATTIQLVHALSTEDVLVGVKVTATKEDVMVCWRGVDANTIELDFAVAPTTGEFTVVIGT
ncbi:MAG: hypothetical protein KAG66_00515 [Methylococcales bacterium]|nr:hypothetical protein [Methylococcales bacterium]